MSDWSSKLKNFGKGGSSEEKQRILPSEDVEHGYEETSLSDGELSRNENSLPSSGSSNQDHCRRNYFNDGKTRIDFVLVYEENHVQPKAKNSMSDSDKAKQRQTNNTEMQHTKWRKKFMRNLFRTGVQMEKDEDVGKEKTIHYCKLSCPWDVLVHYAEDLNVRAPLQRRQYRGQQWSSALLKKLKIPNFMEIDVPNKPDLYFTCTFKKSKLHKFLGSDDHENYFSTTERSRIMYEILQTTLYGKKKRAELGVERLISEGVFSTAFPLHDGSDIITKDMPAAEMSERQVLHEYWARWGRWFKYQPLDHIRHYFGEKIGIYFAWLGFYTAWLLPVAIIGLVVFVAGAVSAFTNTPVLEICQSGSNFTMCPLCEMCGSWSLNSTCLMAKAAYLFDNVGTVFFATLMSFWAVFFLEFWKRKSAMIAHHWEVMNFEDEEERPRPEYNARAPTLEVNPVTGIVEPHFPPKQRIRRIFTGFAILVIMLSVVLILVVSVIVYKGIIGMILMQNRSLQGKASLLESFSGSVLNLILIMLMANVYTAVAELLTKWEMHRTQTDYENSLTFKVFIFQFVNYYSSIFYIAFFKGNMVGYPGHYMRTLGIRNEACGSGGCLIELAQQLFVIMVGKQAINNVQELVLPKFWQWCQSRKMKKEQRQMKPWEVDYHQLVNFEGLFDEYLEMVLQFGFITIFVAAFPLAPLFALLNNWIEIRLDARKLVCETRRPVPERAQNIGVWYEILDALVQIAVVTNAFLIAFTSDFIPRLVYKNVVGNGTLEGYVNFSLSYAPNISGLGECRYKGYLDRNGDYTMYYYQLLCAKLAFVIVFEHVVFFIGRTIDWGIPDVPESLQLKIKRENFLAKQALADNLDNTNVMMEVMRLYSKNGKKNPPRSLQTPPYSTIPEQEDVNLDAIMEEELATLPQVKE